MSWLFKLDQIVSQSVTITEGYNTSVAVAEASSVGSMSYHSACIWMVTCTNMHSLICSHLFNARKKSPAHPGRDQMGFVEIFAVFSA